MTLIWAKDSPILVQVNPHPLVFVEKINSIQYIGGRDLKGTKEKPKNVRRQPPSGREVLIPHPQLRTAPQSSHQTFENPMNQALLVGQRSISSVIAHLRDRSHRRHASP